MSRDSHVILNYIHIDKQEMPPQYDIPKTTAHNIPEPIIGQDSLNQLDNPPAPMPNPRSDKRLPTTLNAFPQFPAGGNKRDPVCNY